MERTGQTTIEAFSTTSPRALGYYYLKMQKFLAAAFQPSQQVYGSCANIAKTQTGSHESDATNMNYGQTGPVTPANSGGRGAGTETLRRANRMPREKDTAPAGQRAPAPANSQWSHAERKPFWS